MRRSTTCYKCALLRVLVIALSVVFAWVFLTEPQPALASDGDVVSCTAHENVSQSAGYASVDPALVVDRSGRVHLFWAERVSGEPHSVPNVPDALMYSTWENGLWSQPIDLFLSPREFFNRRITGIRALIDDEQMIHLLWQGPDNTLYYSNGPAVEAGSAQRWAAPTLLASDATGSQFAADIAYEAPGTLHIIYGKGVSDSENRTIAYIRSTDGGQRWSEPTPVYKVLALGRGTSNLRLLVNPPGHVYASWTEWDETGNGQAVYFAQSRNSGRVWQEPVQLDQRLGEEYERDWTTLAVLGDNELVAFWEGGYRAYRQAQYSSDGGETWSAPIDTLDWLIADNGYAEFVRDSAGRLHLFVFQRVREGNDDKGRRQGLWHTVWEGGREWREPELVGTESLGNYAAVAVRGGNELFAAWFDYFDYEIFTTRCNIVGTPAVPFESPDQAAADLAVGYTNDVQEVPAVSATTPDTENETASPTRLAATDLTVEQAPIQTMGLGRVLVFSLLPSLAALLAFVVLKARQLRR